MSEYTPTTDEVEAAYVLGEWKVNPAFPTAETIACFRNWLAAHDRQVQAEAWDEGFRAGVTEGISFQAGDSRAHTWPTAYINPHRIENQETP